MTDLAFQHMVQTTVQKRKKVVSSRKNAAFGGNVRDSGFVEGEAGVEGADDGLDGDTEVEDDMEVEYEEAVQA